MWQHWCPQPPIGARSSPCRGPSPPPACKPTAEKNSCVAWSPRTSHSLPGSWRCPSMCPVGKSGSAPSPCPTGILPALLLPLRNNSIEEALLDMWGIDDIIFCIRESLPPIQPPTNSRAISVACPWLVLSSIGQFSPRSGLISVGRRRGWFGCWVLSSFGFPHLAPRDYWAGKHPLAVVLAFEGTTKDLIRNLYFHAT